MGNQIRAEWSCAEVINYALQQNHVPVVREIRLTNLTDEDMSGLQVKLEAEPLFAYEWSKRIDVLPSGQTADAGAVHVQLIPTFLGNQSERLNGTLTLTVTQGETVLVQERVSIGILAFDEWSGLTILPEMAAAFVTPNTPFVIQIVREAADWLGKWSGSSAFSAYQSKDPNRVRLQAAAIYHAIQQKAIVYCVAPPSFEQIGQRVRLPDFLMAHRIGNCLDLSLLYAACLEAVGLHPLLVFTEGHAFTGVWLIEETFSESVQDDSSLLTKRMASGINEICLIEATFMAEGQSANFDRSTDMAASHLHNPDSFICAVDIRRARAGSIRPLPQRNAAAEHFQLDEESEDKAALSSLAPELIDVIAKPLEVDSVSMPKQRYWERRLLDLSLRNSLLNFRLTKSSVQLMTLQLGELEDALAERVDFQLLARPHDWQDSLRSTTLFQALQSNHPMDTLLREEFNRKRLRVDLPEDELERRLVHLHRSAKLSLEENGANTLFLALGSLKWYETNASEAPRYAPLVLVPVHLVKTVLKGGFIIRGRDEEPQLNITMLEMLRQDFGISIGGLDPLSRDDKGIDLKQIFAALRHALMPFARWDVEETVMLGLFSFGQFVMWNDLRMRAAELAENAIVGSLMEGKLNWEQPDEGADTDHSLDDSHPTELLVPISTDSSQLKAIKSAVMKESFVLHGPPGTGKSQTITNMIAGALAEGKRVLFVAEKMAALSVVQNRLEQIGLGPFCLELHSNKSTKRAVLDQLQAALDVQKLLSPSDWKSQADRLAGLRKELNDYIAALHQKRHFGYSLFEAISEYERIGAGSEAVIFNKHEIEGLDDTTITRWRDLSAQLEAAGRQCEYRVNHPWQEARCTSYSQGMRAELDVLLSDYLSKLEGLPKHSLEAMDTLRLPRAELTSKRLQQLVSLCHHMLRIPDIKPALLNAGSIAESADKLRCAAEQGQRRDELKRRMNLLFKPEALQFDASQTLAEWSKTELKWFLPKWLGQNRIVKLLRTIAMPEAELAKDQVKDQLSSLIQWQEEERKLAEQQTAIASLVSSSMVEMEKWSELAEAGEWAAQLHTIFVEWFSDPIAAAEACSAIASLLSGGRSGVELYFTQWQTVSSIIGELRDQETRLADLLLLDKEKLESDAADEAWHSYMGRKAVLWQNSLGSLRDWCAWRRVRVEAEAAGLTPLVAPYEEGRLGAEELVPAFERGLSKSCANYIFEKDDRLGTFSGTLFEDKIARYRETDKRFEELTRQEIVARLSSRVPQISQEAAQSSEAGILQRAIRSGGRAMSIRKLLDSIPNLLPRLTPCMLMSPISVAQYLDPGNPKFDLVIFDEASQVPTAQAVGALARGHQAVIVGDPKQLPPTSFFSKGTDEEAEDGALLQDMESILDDCLALGMKQMHLSWHYRSRHESLIAFSNAHYYDNKLLTFPSPDEPVSSVSYHYVEGCYDRGRTKQNRAEAEAVVSEITRRLKSVELRGLSIGVVTFSSIQQTLIEDMLDQALREDSELELLLQQLPEPLFIKNLENVQGDERDIILFSIGYGPDANGKISLNFGPLNREGGWRRLNVAVSRARHEMLVFSTLQSHQLNANRTSAEGVHGLKAFLEYAEKGKQGLPVSANAKQTATYSDIHRNLADELKKRGYSVDLYVGTSGYRVDAGMLDPIIEGQYRLGILLDGPMYASANTARDRDVLRIQVLEGLGWSLHSLWLPDWWDNRSRELDKIERAFKEAQNLAVIHGDTQRSMNSAMPDFSRPVNTDTANVSWSANDERSEVSSDIAYADKMIDSGESVGTFEAQRYRVTELASDLKGADAFYMLSSTQLALAQMMRVLNEEGPISRNLLMKRVLQAWGISRAGAKLERRFDELFAKMQYKVTLTDEMPFLWPMTLNPGDYEGFRVSGLESERRSAEELPAEETANAVRHVLKSQISLPIDDLVRQVVRLLGYSRSGAALDKAVRCGIAKAVERGYALMNEEGRVILNDN